MKQCLKRAKVLCAGLFLALMMVVSVGVNAAQVTSNIDPDHQTEVNFHYEPGKTTISIYKIANITPQSKFTVIAPFDAEPFSKITQLQKEEINNLDAEGYRKLASTLLTYLYTENVTPLYSRETDDNGRYTDKELGTGMFLAVPEGNEDYEPSPSLFSIPGSLGEDGAWIYTIDIELKYKEIDYGTQDLKVVKAWDDDDDAASSRPQSIDVSLLCDGTVKETVKLNADNNWEYQWEALDRKYAWTVQEKVPGGYTNDVISEAGENNTVTYTITNTITEKNPGPDPTTASQGGGTTQAKTTTKSTLPKTGQLWWPIPFLCIGGIVAILVGYIRRKRWEKDHVR